MCEKARQAGSFSQGEPRSMLLRAVRRFEAIFLEETYGVGRGVMYTVPVKLETAVPSPRITSTR
jgi:hypothetical protein